MRPDMPRCSSTQSPPASRIRMYLPRRRKPATRAPVRRAAGPAGRASADPGGATVARTMTRPSSRAAGRASRSRPRGVPAWAARHAIRWPAMSDNPAATETADFGFRRVPRRGEEAAGARGVRQRGAALRPDERPDVARHPPRVEARSSSPRWTRARRGRCSTSPAAPATSASAGWRSGGGPVAAVRRQRRPCWRWRGIGRCAARLIAGIDFVVADAERLPLPDRAVDRVVDRLRPAQLHRQGRGAGRGAARAAAGRPVPLPGVLPRCRWRRCAPLYDAWSFRVLPLLGRVRGAGRGRATTTSPRASAPSPTRRRWPAMMRGGRASRACDGAQPVRAASRRFIRGGGCETVMPASACC